MDKVGSVNWKIIRNRLLEWFPQNGRTFFWRTTRDPYIILVAEILLKRTGATVVERFLPEFLKIFPTMAHLSQAPIEMIERELAPVGLTHQRAHQFKALAQSLMARFADCIPDSESELISLPGIGPYTAAAVLCFAYGQPQAIVDTNVARVLTRVSGIIPSRCEARRSPEVWESARSLIGLDTNTARIINWALLDLGAMFCKARNTLCQECPLLTTCEFASSQTHTG